MQHVHAPASRYMAKEQPKVPARVAAYLTVTEASIKAALIEARSDIFVAAQLLGITAIRLNRAIRVSPVLQACVETTRELGPGVALEVVHKAIEERVALYRVSGLDALAELATIDVNDPNSAKLQVKLAAAARLAGAVEAGGSGGLEETLRELNKSYAENAPRLRVTREKLTVETLPPEREVKSD
jgi:hypothetical protein